MTAAVTVLAVAAAALHVAFFALEALLWRRPAVHRIFGARDEAAAAAMAPAMANLGFYNLFLALGTIAGAWLHATGNDSTLLTFCLVFMVGAALVLVARSRQMWRGALIQGAAPALALTLLAFS